eukprot:5041264-Pyramimonas_sp.AAC.1
MPGASAIPSQRGGATPNDPKEEHLVGNAACVDVVTRPTASVHLGPKICRLASPQMRAPTTTVGCPSIDPARARDILPANDPVDIV